MGAKWYQKLWDFLASLDWNAGLRVAAELLEIKFAKEDLDDFRKEISAKIAGKVVAVVIRDSHDRPTDFEKNMISDFVAAGIDVYSEGDDDKAKAIISGNYILVPKRVDFVISGTAWQNPGETVWYYAVRLVEIGTNTTLGVYSR